VPRLVKTERVFIGVLAFGNTTNVSLVQMAHELPGVSADPSNRFEFTWDVQAGTQPQEYARNLLIGKFLRTNCDTLLMIDDDMIQHGWLTLAVLDTPDYDIAGPIQLMFMPKRKASETEEAREPAIYPCAFMFTDREEMSKIRPVWPMRDTKVMTVDAVGSGCMAIRRHVLEDERMLLEPGLDPPALFKNQYRANGERIRGLDVDFCRRATMLGHTVRVNWRAEIGHHKRVDLNQVEEYAKTQFHLGYKEGVTHAVQVAQEQSATSGGQDREPRPEPRYEAVGESRLDRVARPASGQATG
jgi:hypothetical protein